MIIGHQQQWQYLKKLAESDKLAHAYLFCGQKKLGKKTIAIEFAKWLFKDDVIKRQHPDFIFLAPEKREIQISQIRECIWRLSLKPSVAPFKIALIDEAHCLNQEAQNSLLKTLEEPRGKTLIFLVTEYPERLFPTIISRCQILKFYSVPKEEIERYLEQKNVSNHEIKQIVEISEGQPGRALDFMSDPQKLKTQRTVISDIIKMSNSDMSFRFQYAKNLTGEPQNLKDTLDIWLRHFRKVLISKVNGVSQGEYSLGKLRSVIKLIQETNFLISTTNVNPRLALEILMMEL